MEVKVSLVGIEGCIYANIVFDQLPYRSEGYNYGY